MYCVIDGSAKISPTAVIEDFVVIKGNCIVGETAWWVVSAISKTP